MSNSFSKIDSIVTSITPEQWLNSMPSFEMTFFGHDLIIIQPSSTILVYLLGLLTLFVGFFFISTRGYHRSRLWWGIGLVFDGFAAMLAGTGYQAFGYELKCAGREFCLWTNDWEVIYTIFNALAMNALVISMAFACCPAHWRKYFFTYAIINSIMHTIAVAIGYTLPVRFLVSFENLLLFALPAYLGFIALNSWRFYQFKNIMDLALLTAWVLLGVSIVALYTYGASGFTRFLWEQGTWFSENDILHVILIGWTLYVQLILGCLIKDYDGKVLCFTEKVKV